MNYLYMLSQLGAGSAHPGGYSATLAQLDTLPFPEGSDILEVGCGTGRTACLLAERGHRVTAMDLQPEMIEKARLRAQRTGQEVNFLVGDIGDIPFPDESFDIVLAESVTNFSDIPRAVSEYARVLKPGGTLYDREVIRLQAEDAEATRELCDFFGFGQIWSEQQWLAVLADCFADSRVWDRMPLNGNSLEDEARHPDPHKTASDGAFADLTLLQTALKYSRLMDEYRDYLGAAVMIGVKALR